MKVRMQYPHIEGNEMWDGKIHKVDALELNQIKDCEIYLLDYYDEDYECDCTTILLKTNEGFRKIPLREYDSLFDLLEEEKLDLLSVNIDEIEKNNKENLIEMDEVQENIEEVLKKHPQLASTKSSITVYYDGREYYIDRELKHIITPQMPMLYAKYEVTVKNVTRENINTKPEQEIEIEEILIVVQNGGYFAKIGSKLIPLNQNQLLEILKKCAVRWSDESGHEIASPISSGATIGGQKVYIRDAIGGSHTYIVINDRMNTGGFDR